MKAYISDLFRDHQGRSDEQVLISMVGALVFFSLEIYVVVVRGAAFDPLGFGAGIGTLLGATSAGFGLRARWTPEPPMGAPNIDPMTGRFLGEP